MNYEFIIWHTFSTRVVVDAESEDEALEHIKLMDKMGNIDNLMLEQNDLVDKTIESRGEINN